MNYCKIMRLIELPIIAAEYFVLSIAFTFSFFISEVAIRRFVHQGKNASEMNRKKEFFFFH